MSAHAVLWTSSSDVVLAIVAQSNHFVTHVVSKLRADMALYRIADDQDMASVCVYIYLYTQICVYCIHYKYTV